MTEGPETPWKAGTGQAVSKLYAWIAIEPDGEGLMAFWLDGMGWMPMIGADRARMESMRPQAEQISKESGKTAVLKMFGSAAEIDRVG